MTEDNSGSGASVMVVLGTRPEIIKLAPVLEELRRREVPTYLLHTGQHYSELLADVMFDRLELPVPDENLGVGSKSSGEQTAEMLAGIERILARIEPEVVLVQGDTNSVLAGALAVSKIPDVSLGHVEAGLRSFDRDMPEEINRRLTDAVSEFCFAPTKQAARNLVNEDVSEDRIAVTGNTVVDAVQKNYEIADEESTVLLDLSLGSGDYGLVTLHRQVNVDDRERFREILAGIQKAHNASGMEFVYPIHPRAARRIEKFGLTVPESIRVIDPLDYLDFLALEGNATVVVTDSGGVQEEACILQVPCVTVRDSTERPETIDAGANTLVSADRESIVEGIVSATERERNWENPLGDGDAAEHIVETLVQETEIVGNR